MTYNTPNTVSRTSSPETCGVYCIQNTVNSKCYVGSARVFAIRWYNHRYALRKGRHPNTYLQRSWTKHGEKTFMFKVLCLCPLSALACLESQFIQQLQTADPRWGDSTAKGFNLK